LFGATPVGSCSGGRAGSGELFVAEACEYRESFLQLRPTFAVLLGIEPDHFDFFTSPEHTQAVYLRFARRVSPGGLIVANAACKTTLAVLREVRTPVETFALTGDADWQANNIEHTRGRYRFELAYRDRRLGGVSLHVLGRHQVLNAVAAAAVAHAAGADSSAIVRGLTDFQGLQRRLQIAA